MPAFRLLGVREGVAPYAPAGRAVRGGSPSSQGCARPSNVPFVTDAACSRRSSAPPGVGKSRLTHEFTQAVEHTATVLVGRARHTGRESRSVRLPTRSRRFSETTRELRRAISSAPPTARRPSPSVSRGARCETDAEGSGEELPSAFRRLLEAIAAERPLVLVLDDIHWAEPTLLDLVEYLVAFSSGSPILRALLVATGAPRGSPDVGRLLARERDVVPRWSRCLAARVCSSSSRDWTRRRLAAERGASHPQAERQPAVPRSSCLALDVEPRPRLRPGSPADDPGAPRRPPRPARRGGAAPCSSAPRSRERSSTERRSASLFRTRTRPGRRGACAARPRATT